MVRKLRRFALLIAALAGFAAVLTLVLVQGHDGEAGRSASAPAVHDTAHARPAARRTMFVSADREPAPSLPGSTMRAVLAGGALPSRPVDATVVTDEDCAPDAKGFSRCLNRLRLPDGRKLAVRHPHRMADVPCMSPGEVVSLRPA